MDGFFLVILQHSVLVIAKVFDGDTASYSFYFLSLSLYFYFIESNEFSFI